MQRSHTTKRTLLYQKIGNELHLGTLTKIELIQELWSGYGELVRVTFPHKSIIIKHIQLPQPSQHPRGWNSDISHQRKLHSYQVEVNWYQNFSHPSDKRCRIPKGLKCFQTDNEWLIVMEDLANVGFPKTIRNPNINQIKSALIWLANFHARHMHTRSNLLWKTGTYWHLETRPDEYNALQDSELKKSAQRIDAVLKNAKYQTIVHGDAKLANFCFSEDGKLASAIDFQYVGHGCGMKDVAYFMSSAIEPHKCEEMEEWVLDTYFQSLDEALKHYQPQLDSAQVAKEWRPLFPVAWADFQRFIKGWSPGHFKINTYSEALTSKGLKYI